MTEYQFDLPHNFVPLAELAILNGRTPSKKEWKTWVLKNPAMFKYASSDELICIITIENFMTDFASIPWIMRWWRDGSIGPQRVAGYFHDWLYSSQSIYSRKESDRIFRMVIQGLDSSRRSFFTRWAMWSGLRLFGWFAWNRDQKEYLKNPMWRILR